MKLEFFKKAEKVLGKFQREITIETKKKKKKNSKKRKSKVKILLLKFISLATNFSNPFFELFLERSFILVKDLFGSFI